MQHVLEATINKVKLGVKATHSFKFKHLTLISCLYLDLCTFKFEIKLNEKQFENKKNFFNKISFLKYPFDSSLESVL